MSPQIHKIFHAASPWHLSCFAFASVLCWLASGLVNPASATVFRWEDDQGATHYSEIVPERYRSVAKPVDVTATDLTSEQSQDAIRRAQKEKARAEAIQSNRSPPPVRVPLAVPQPLVKRPAELPTDQTDCDTWQRLYEESMECFGPYRTVNGIKPGAFEACNVVAEPPQDRCRMVVR